MSEVAAQILAQGSQAPEQETSAETSTAPTEQRNPTFDAIAKMERKLKMREQEFKSKEQQMAEMQAKLAEFEGFDQNPLEVLKRKGYDIEKINKLALETLTDDDLDPVARKFKELESKQEQMRAEILKEAEAKIAAKEKEIQDRENQYQIQMFKKQLEAHVRGKSDEYEFTLAHPEGLDLVYDVIYHDLEMRSKEGGDVQPMDFDTAAQKVEAYLDAEAQKYLSLNKVKSRFGAESQDWSKAFKLEAPKTLTNDITPKSSIDPSQLSEEQRIKLAAEGIKTGKWAFLNN